MAIEGPQPTVPLRGRYSSKEMKTLFPPREDDYRFNCSPEMRDVFSERAKYGGWRELWICLAEAERELGLPISEEQIAALKIVKDDIDFARARQLERKKKHDVMAYKQEFAEKADAFYPKAGDQLHLGATSMYVCDNEELTAMRNGLELVAEKTRSLQEFTGADLSLVIGELGYRAGSLKARGAKGATGTQASYLELFGDHGKVVALDQMIAERMGFAETYEITGQTYPRIVDYQVLSSLALLANILKESLSDPEKKRIDRDVIDINNKAKQAATMASEPWLERSLDDSAERRIIISESFYQIDDILQYLLENQELVVREAPDTMANKSALQIITAKTANAIDKIFSFAEQHRDTVCTGYTHGQFAQPTTYGKRIALWAYNFVLALKDLEHISSISRGSGRALDGLAHICMNQVAIAAGKMATDVRLLQHDLEVNEPFGKSQVGSSAMAYKKNPMKCERINGLVRNKIGSTNWEADSLDYSFLNTDAILELVLTVFSGDTEKQNGFTVHAERARANLVQYMPFLAAEGIMLKASIEGLDSKEAHEKVRLASLAARANIDRGSENNMLELLAEAGFDVDLSAKEAYLDPESHIGRAKEQVDEFGRDIIAPIRKKYAVVLGREGDVQV
ncbi:hypothetical protein KY329_03640 [Candidatus Woesearchaeota archaeon]|nr:hypothetical protein [Candidatus Woesearchaeota archaeon]